MTGRADHVLYLWLLAAVTGSSDDRDKAVVQTAVLHRPYLDDWGNWVCERCSFCRSTDVAAPDAGPLACEVHLPVFAVAPCEELRLLAWPYRQQPGYLPQWEPEEVIPTNPPTLLGGNVPSES